MLLVRKGDTCAFHELFSRYHQRLLHYFYRMLQGNEAKAQDFLQRLFMKIVEKPKLYDPQYRFSTWIYTVATNMCKNEYRSWNKHNFVDCEGISSEAHDHYFSAERSRDLGKFFTNLLKELNKFTPNNRSIFLLRYYENLSLKEISDIFALPLGTVKSRLFTITKKLADKLESFKILVHEVTIDEKRKSTE